jgi:hypothetical protein
MTKEARQNRISEGYFRLRRPGDQALAGFEGWEWKVLPVVRGAGSGSSPASLSSQDHRTREDMCCKPKEQICVRQMTAFFFTHSCVDQGNGHKDTSYAREPVSKQEGGKKSISSRTNISRL